MAGFDSPLPPPASDPDSASAQRNARYGLVLFAVYLVVYLAFVLLNAFAPDTMNQTVVAGLNLAVVYGFALIAIALLLAAVYGWLCRSPRGTP